MELFPVFLIYLLTGIIFISPAFSAEPDIQYTIANDVSTNNTLEFDLLLFDLDPSQDFQLATFQAGVYLNPACYTGGIVTAQILPGSSMLNAAQIPTSITFTNSAHIIKLAAKAPPGCGSGTIISTNPMAPTRICRIQLINTIPWVSCTTADLAFCFTAQPYPTKISFYQESDCIQTLAGLNSSICYSLASNQPFNVLIPAPIAFTVTGGGEYCAGECGLPVGLSGSETGVTYILYRNGISMSMVLAGTGASLSFGCVPAGIYTIIGERPGCIGAPSSWTQMVGSAVISTNLPTVGGIVNGPDSAVEGVTSINLMLTGQTGDVLKWQKCLNAGAWMDLPNTTTTYTEIPTPAGTWEYRAVVQNGDCDIVNSSCWNVTVTSRSLTLKFFLQGLYRVNSSLMDKAQDENGDHYPGDIADHVDVSLAQNSYPYTILFSVPDVPLNRNGIVTIDLPSGSNLSYYLVINHRNSIETWSAFPINLNNEHTSYNFTNGYYKAYGNNMFLMGSVWVIYTGDVNQDGIIDSGDMIPTDNLNSVFATGYLPEDNNGDGLIDSSDMSMIGNNAIQFIGKITP